MVKKSIKSGPSTYEEKGKHTEAPKKPQYPMEPDQSTVIHAESVQTTASDDRFEPLGEGQR